MYNWEYENSINSGTELLDLDQPREHKYSQWRTNSALSNHIETLSYVSDMNLNHHLSNKMHYHYLFNKVRKQRRYGKKKTDQDKLLEKQYELEQQKIALVQEHYKYNVVKAKQALIVLTAEQLNIIRQKQEKGG